MSAGSGQNAPPAQLPGDNPGRFAMKVRDIMTRPVVTVELDDRLHQVKEIFDATGFHHLLAVDADGTLYGVVSDRDLLRALSPFIGSTVESPRDAATLNKAVHQIMTRKPLTLPPEAGVEAAIALFLAHPVSCLPVVDARARPVGIVSWRDLLRGLAQAQGGGTPGIDG